MLFSKFTRELSCEAFISWPSDTGVRVLQRRHRAPNAIIFANDVFCAAKQRWFQRAAGIGQMIRRHFAQALQSQRRGGGGTFFAALVVEARQKTVLHSGVRDNQRKPGREWDRSNFLRLAIEENEMIRTAKDRRDLIKQARADAGEFALRALTKLRDFHRIDSQFVQFHQQPRCRDLESRGTCKACARLQVAGDFRIEATDFETGVKELLHHAERVIRPAQLRILRLQIAQRNADAAVRGL